MPTDTHRAERVRIEAGLQAAANEIRLLDEKLTNEPEWGLGEGDPTIQEWELNFALKQEAQRKLQMLQTALKKVARGKYGLCERCNGAINPERLAILPQTTLCIDCARKK